MAIADDIRRLRAEAEFRQATAPLGLPPADALAASAPAPKSNAGLDALPQPPLFGAEGKGAAPIESGTLPGEEQVTSMDVFNRLKPQEQAAIRQKYESGSHADAESFEDYLGFKFGDMPPDIREIAMRAEYGSPAALSPVAKARLAAGKPLPEGLKPGVYSPEQMRGMSRDVYSPEVPQTFHGGTFTFNADGSRSSRAPEAFRLTDAAKVAAYAGEGSFEHNRALGKAYGIDVSQYDGQRPEDRALLAADVAREKERHDSLASKYDTVRTPMGGTRYKANAQKMAEAQAQQDLAMSPERKREFANTIATRFAGMMTPEQMASLDTLARTPDGFAQLRALNQQLTRQRDAESMRSYRNKQANYNLTQQMGNPNYAPGMAVRSLIEAVRSGDPTMQAAAYAVAGNQPGFQRSMDLATAQSIGASQLAQAQTYADGRGADPAADATLGAQFGTQFNDALSLPPAQRAAAVATVLRKSGTPEDQIAANTQAILLDYEARTNPQGPVVQAHLQSLRNNKPEFVAFLQRMGYSREQAEAAYNNAAAPSGTTRGLVRGAATGMFGPAGAAAAQGLGY